jgi:hypothetical protein
MATKHEMGRHSLERTSPKGGPFLGTCRKCGQQNLTLKAAFEECENVRGTTPEQDILEAINPGGKA